MNAPAPYHTQAPAPCRSDHVVPRKYVSVRSMRADGDLAQSRIRLVPPMIYTVPGVLRVTSSCQYTVY